jgi:hypothetical protein
MKTITFKIRTNSTVNTLGNLVEKYAAKCSEMDVNFSLAQLSKNGAFDVCVN